MTGGASPVGPLTQAQVLRGPGEIAEDDATGTLAAVYERVRRTGPRQWHRTFRGHVICVGLMHIPPAQMLGIPALRQIHVDVILMITVGSRT